MGIRAFLWATSLVALAALSGLIFMITMLSPEAMGVSGMAVFYLLLLIFLSGITSLFLFWLRKKRDASADEKAEILGISLRQAMIISGALAFGLLLQQLRLLIWWDMLLVISGALLLELYFLTRKS